MQEFLNIVREAATKTSWSRGVELAREHAVHEERSRGDEIHLRVSDRVGIVAASVTLDLDLEEWECSCRSQEDPCVHVTAACIALHRARREGKPLAASTTAAGTIRYCLSRGRPGLALEREIVTRDKSVLLESTLVAIARGRVDGPAISVAEADLDAERALGTRRRGAIPPGLLPGLFAALERCDDVQLDGQSIRVVQEPVTSRCRLVDAPGGFRLYLEPAPELRESLGDGVVICGDALRLIESPRLAGRELEELPRGRFFAHGQVTELLTEVLPDLASRIAVDIETERLPKTTSSERPRILLELERRGDRLSVLPLLVYGDPIVARVDAGNLTHLQGRIPLRDKVAEKSRERHLRQSIGLAPGHRVEFDPAEAITFASRIAHWTGEIKGNAHRDFFQLPTLIPRVEITDDRIDVSFESPASADTGTAHPAVPAHSAAEPEAVLRSWRGGESLAPLRGGGFAALPEDWLQRFGNRIADLLAAQSDTERLPRGVLPDLGELCDELEVPRPASLGRLQPLIDGFTSIPETPLPEGFQGTLRPYQRKGVDWLAFLSRVELGALLADDMGLGKTVQALCAVVPPCLVVSPTSVLFNWADELERFRPDLSYTIFHGPKRELDPSADVVLTSYALLRLDEASLGRQPWHTVVLDEAQNIKNPESQVARAAFRLPGRFRMALTGTPVENRLDELWSQFNFLNPGLFGTRRDFRERYARPIEEGDIETTARLRERIRPFLLRRRKRDVATELPPRTEIVLHCELSDAERGVYDAVRAATVPEVVSQLQAGGNVLAALEALLRLRQAACHSGLVPGQEATTSSKLELLVSRLSEAMADGHRALVFSQWTTLLDFTEPHLRSNEIPFERLDGSTRDRRAVVERFQNPAGPPVMLVSLRAGGTGLNLTAADHIFLLDPWWNPAVEDQAADRAHRIGQQRPVVVHRIVAHDTVEEGILELHARKRSLSEAALEDGRAESGLTRQDLLALLS